MKTKLTTLYNILSLAKPLAQDIISGPSRFNRDFTQAARAAQSLYWPAEVPGEEILSRIRGTMHQLIGLMLSCQMGILALAIMTPLAAAPSSVIGLAGAFGVAAFSPLTTRTVINSLKYAHTAIVGSNGDGKNTKEQVTWPQVEGFPAFSKAWRELDLSS